MAGNLNCNKVLWAKLQSKSSIAHLIMSSVGHLVNVTKIILNVIKTRAKMKQYIGVGQSIYVFNLSNNHHIGIKV